MAAFSMRSRRRKIIFVCAALGLGGYASYRVYKSSFVSCKRRRLSSFLGSLSRLAEVFALGIDSTSVVAGDLRAFLFSDEDDVPRSLRQSLKIMGCKEFQDALTIFSVCVSRGVVGSILETGWNIDEAGGGSRRNGHLHKQASDDKRADEGVYIVFENKEQVVIQSKDEKEKHVLTEETQSGSKKYSMKSTESSFRRQNQEGLTERLMEKLFTDAGKGFASAVLGSVARNTTLSFLEGLTKFSERPSTSEWDSRGLAPDVCNLQGRVHEISSIGSPDVRVDSFGGAGTFLDLACSSKGRTLIAECIQAFVGTAVSVYLEKTRDVNFYEEMVAGMTKPSHQPAVKELLTSACSRAMETLVRTSHEVLSAGPPADSNVTPEVPQKQELGKVPLEKLVNNLGSPKENGGQCLPESDHQGAGSSASSSNDDVESFLCSDSGSTSSLQSDVSLRLESSRQPSENAKTMIVVTSNNSSKISLPNWVEGVSRTLAVPSNRKLLIDVAGTVTSEAIHSFFEVFLGVVAPYLRGNFKYRCTVDRRETRDVEEEVTGKHLGMETFHNMQGRVVFISREVVGKSLVAMTVCLAILMHVLVDRVLEPV